MKKTKFLLGLLIITVPLFLTGCYVPFLNKEITIPFLEKKPQTAWDLMVKKMEQARNYKREDTGDILLNFNVNKKNASSKEMTKEGVSPSGLSFFQGKSKVDIKIKSQAALGEKKVALQAAINTLFQGKGLNLSLLQVSFSAKGEKQGNKQQLYFKLNKLESAVFPLKNWQKYVGKWYKTTGKTYNKGDYFNGVGIDVEFSQKTIPVFQKYHAFQAIKRLRDQKIDGYNCYHLQIGVNKENLIKALKEIYSSANKQKKEKNNSIFSKNKKDELVTINNTAQILSKLKGEVWIDKDSFYLRKYNVELDLSKKDFPQSGLLSMVFKMLPLTDIKISFSGHLYDFGQKSSIVFPTKAITIPLSFNLSSSGNNSFGGSSQKPPQKLGAMNSASQKESPYLKEYLAILQQKPSLLKEENQKSKVDTDHDGIPDIWEIKIGSDPYAADTDGDGYSDKVEGEKGYNLWGRGTMVQPIQSSLKTLKKLSVDQSFYIFNHYLTMGPDIFCEPFIGKDGVLINGEHYYLLGLKRYWQKNNWFYWVKAKTSLINNPQVNFYDTMQSQVGVIDLRPVTFSANGKEKLGEVVIFKWERPALTPSEPYTPWKLTEIKFIK